METRDSWHDNEKYRELFINNPMPMWIYDRETKAFLEVNEEAIRHYGYSRKEFLSMTINDIRPAEDIPKLDNLKRVLTEFSSIYSGRWRHYKKNGELMHVEVTSHLIEYDEREAALVLINDITEKVHAEERREFERLDKEALINNTQDMIWSLSPELTLIAANNSFVESLKRASGKYFKPGDKLLEPPLPEEFIDFWREIYLRALNGESFEQEVWIPEMKQLKGTWFDIRFRPIKVDGKITGVACYARDVTERKKYEQQLRESNERYNLISMATSDMVWDVNLLTGEVYRNPEGWRKIFGGREEDVPRSWTELNWDERVHPDDREKLRKLTADLYNNNTDKNFFEAEVRVLRNDGTYAHTLDRGYVVRNEEGKAVRLIGATRDITEKIEAQESLRKVEMRKQQEITEAVITAQEHERQEIGRELHDNINQMLASARMYLSLVNETQIDEVQVVSKVDELLGSAIEEIRAISHALIAPSLGKTKLREAVSLLLDSVSQTRNINVQKEFSNLQENEIPEKLKLSIYRIVQEQINNIQKYAKATNVSVKLVQKDNKIMLSIEDDGIGFDVAKQSKGVGLMNIKTRASLFKGQTKIISSPGAGCKLRVSFPLDNQ
jgi:PAS domain S-box-containing protein